MYCGQIAKPRPTPRPQTSRPKNTDAKDPESAMTNMPMAYSTIANLTHFTAPCLLYTTPPPIAPTALMKFRQPTATSACDDVKSRSRDMGSSAPAMTPMSYPSSAAKMETVHTDWMASHSSVPLPSSPSRRVISGSGRSEMLNAPCARSASFARCCCAGVFKPDASASRGGVDAPDPPPDRWRLCIHRRPQAEGVTRAAVPRPANRTEPRPRDPRSAGGVFGPRRLTT